MTNRVYFDCEFIEDGRTIDLLSIGMVRDDGATLYLESNWADRRRASDWVVANVLPHLHGPQVSREEMARRIVDFVGPEPEFWACYADYDWVALCQVFGPMIDLPAGWPMYCHDFKQHADFFGITTLPKQDPAHDGPEHDALADALWLKRVSVPHLTFRVLKDE